MTIILAILAALFLAFAIVVLIKNKKLEDNALRIQKETQAAIAEAQKWTPKFGPDAKLDFSGSAEHETTAEL